MTRGRGRPAGAVAGAAMAAVALAAACATSGREIVEGVRYYPAWEEEPERSQGSWQDVPILVVVGEAGAEGVRGPRALAVRDALWRQLPVRRDLWRTVVAGEAQGDTLGGLLWDPAAAMGSECTSYEIIPADSVRPQREVCQRIDTTSSEVWSPEDVQRAAIEVGGNAVLFVREEYAGTFRGLRGWVLRCPEGPSGPACAR